MQRFKFRDHQIKRNCSKEYHDPRRYMPFLLEDFSHRCCYCNVSEKTLDIVSFQVDHFIPEHVFRGKRDGLFTLYDNLMLSCPKCNRAKSDHYKGDITSPSIENDLFYNPETTDYNSIFYRNELGGISSDDAKGKDMIKRLKLYRPLHNYAWILEKLDVIISQLDHQIENSDDEKRDSLRACRNDLAYKYYKMRTRFVVAYRQK